MKRFFLLVTVLCFLLAGCGFDAPSTVSGTSTEIVEEPSDTASVPESAQHQGELPASQPFDVRLFAMDTYMELRAYGDGAEDALQAVSSMLTELDQLLSVTDEGSEIYALNHGEGQPAAVSEQTYELIEDALALSRNLADALDMTIYPVSRAWGFTTGSYQIPSDSQLQALLPFVDDTQVVLNERDGTVRIPPSAELDLAAVAKGYAGDRAAEMMKQAGVRSALLNLGSSTIRTVGVKPDGSQWRIAIQDPQDSSGLAGVVTMGEGAMDTSGGYERFFTGADGETYWHILDPKTGYPAKHGLISVTVLSETSFLGDGLSTALFVMGLEEAVRYWRANGGFEFILIADDGSLYLSEGAAERFSPIGNYENAKMTVIKP